MVASRHHRIVTFPRPVSRRGLLSSCGALLLAGCSGGSDSTPTPNPLERGAVTEEEHATVLVIQALNGAGPGVTEAHGVTTESTDGGFRVRARFGLDRPRMGSAGQQRSEVEKSFRKAAVDAFEKLAHVDGFDRLASVALRGTVPTGADVETTDGRAVAIELDASMETVRSIDWSDYAPSNLPEDVDSYTVHRPVFADA
jgi:hypothetical protein